MPTWIIRRADTLMLTAILLLGAWLRFQHFGAIEYNIDQVYPVWQALNTLDTGALPLAGQGTSVLFANPPLTGYLFVPVIALARQPAAAYVVTLMLNTLAIFLAYRALRGLVGTRAALVGAALFAANPWIIEDSRRTWVQSLAPFFVCLTFWALAPALTGQTRRPARHVLIALVGLALFAHTYLLAYALAAPVGLLIAWFWRRVPRRALSAGVAIFAGLMLLYGIGLAREWDSTRRRAEEFSSGNAALSDEALRHAVRLVTGWDYAAARGTRAPANDATLRQGLSDAAHWAWTLALAGGVGLAIRAVARRAVGDPCTRDAAIILLVWALLPVLLMSYVSRVVHPFYLLLSVPATHGLAAWGVTPLLRRPRLAWIVALAVTGTGVINGLNAVRFAQQSAAFPGEDLPYTLPLAEATALGTRLRAAHSGDGAIISMMDTWTPSTLVGQIVRTVRVSQFDRAALIPAAGAVLILAERDPAAPIPPPLYAHRAGAPLVLADGARLEIWQAGPQDAMIAQPADIPSDIDVRFAGWTLTGELRPGQRATLDTFWRVEALRPERGIWAFAPTAHVFNAAEERILIADGTVIPALDWAAGDLLVYRLALDIPPDAAAPLAVDLGLYDGVRGVSAIFRLAAGDRTEYTPGVRIIGPQQAG